jgi:hypothetical protein
MLFRLSGSRCAHAVGLGRSARDGGNGGTSANYRRDPTSNVAHKRNLHRS